MTEAREIHIHLAKLAEQAERYEEMVKHMKDAIAIDSRLSIKERNLLSVAYKNVIGARRASWRIVSSIEQKEESDVVEALTNATKSYRAKIEEEMSEICNDLLEMLDHLFDQTDSDEYKAYYNKMFADYQRYLAEFTTGDKREEAAKKALEAYEAAYDCASKELHPTHPTRLGVALNFSVLYEDILNDRKRAIELAKEAFDAAITRLERAGHWDEFGKGDSTLIMQLLRDNMTLWSNEE